MGLDLNVVYHSINSANKGFIESFADFCFRPVLYFSGEKGRIFEVLDQKVIAAEVSFPQVRHESRWDQTFEYLKTVAAIIAYVPGIILGYLAKSFAMLIDSSISKRQEVVAAYIEHPCYAEIPEAKSETLESIHKKLIESSKLIWAKIEENTLEEDFDAVKKDRVSFNKKAAEFWQSAEMVQLVDAAMELMAQELQIFLKELQSDGKDDPKEMAPLLQNQRSKPVNGKYCWRFFAMTGLYHAIRSMKYYVPSNFDKDSVYPLSALEHFEDDKRVIDTKLEAPFFTEGTKPYKWRQYYNYFCHQFKDIFPHMTDGRFQNWAKLDEMKGIFVGQPDTMPT